MRRNNPPEKIFYVARLSHDGSMITEGRLYLNNIGISAFMAAQPNSRYQVFGVEADWEDITDRYLQDGRTYREQREWKREKKNDTFR